jgi:hypothetical protein
MMNSLLSVYLVGAGPGDPDLLTIKALRLIKQVDVIVYDRLVSDPILELIPADTKRIFAGKAARDHYIPQEEINALLVTLAKAVKKPFIWRNMAFPLKWCRALPHRLDAPPTLAFRSPTAIMPMAYGLSPGTPRTAMSPN